MAVRIYSLAKELKLDSKVLVDLCTKAGVTGKGSALASLTDEEVAKVKAFVAGGNKASAREPVAPAAKAVGTATAVAVAVAPAAPEPTTFRREDYIAPGGRRISRRYWRPSRLIARRILLANRPSRGRPSRSRQPFVWRHSLRSSNRRRRPSRPSPSRRNPTLSFRPMPFEPARPEAAIRCKRTCGRPKPSAVPTAPLPVLRPLPHRSPVVEVRATRPRRDRRHCRRWFRPRGKNAAKRARVALRPRPRTKRRWAAASNASSIAAARRPNRGMPAAGRPRTTVPSARAARIRNKRSGTNTSAPRKGKAVLQLPCTVRSFSEAVGVRASQVLGKLMGMGQLANINAELSDELVENLALELGVDVEVRQAEDLESRLLDEVAGREDLPEDLQPRAPIVTFLGHVDHGKTSLLDRIIGINVASGESGGITQHIRAYKIEKDGRPIAFVDTPGHEAFTEMRARGANVTDIAVLVVAADDGVMPQTEEAISHARAAKVPIVVALNKIDLPGIDQNRIMQQLAANELLPTEWGGDTEVVPCSALKGTGMDQLLETLLTIAELHDYKANPSRPAEGTCLEAELHEGRGVVSKLLVQNGTLKVGDIIVCGAAHGRVKAMYDTLDGHKTYPEAGPSTPVNVTGLDVTPGAGDHFYVLDDITQARSIADKRSQLSRQAALGGNTAHVTLENLHERLGRDEVQTLNLILRSDVRGSIEAIQKELGKLSHPEVQIKVLQATVGGISEADVHLADASDAIIIGFNVVPDEKARALAEARSVQIRRYDIIYKLTDDLRAALEGMLKPEKREVDLGRALVQRTFVISRVGTIAGCRVLSGTIERNCRVRIIRENRIIGDYPLESLKREKDDAREVREGYECGMKVGGFNDLKEGDVLEAYKIQEIARTL